MRLGMPRQETVWKHAYVGIQHRVQRYSKPVRVIVKRRLKKGAFVHSYYVLSLSPPSKGQFMAKYHARGGAEVEQFRGDKSGLGLEARRKPSFLGQKGHILLTDLANNLMSDFYHRALVGTRFGKCGPKRSSVICWLVPENSSLTVISLSVWNY